MDEAKGSRDPSLRFNLQFMSPVTLSMMSGQICPGTTFSTAERIRSAYPKISTLEQ